MHLMLFSIRGLGVHTFRDYIEYLSNEELLELESRQYANHLYSSQYVFSRLIAKMCIARYMGLNPARVAIRSSLNKKPILLLDDEEYLGLSVSISHSDDKILLGASHEFSCGVDVQGLIGIQWSIVEEYMGWTEKLTDYLIDREIDQFAKNIPRERIVAILWAGYEAWSKSNECKNSVSSFNWEKISFVGYQTGTDFPVFEIKILDIGIYAKTEIYGILGSDVVIATATRLNFQTI